MQPQGTGLLNAAYFAALTAEINSIDVCAELQAFINEIMATLQAEITAIEAQIAALLPLIVLPTSLEAVIAWIAAFAGPVILAYENYVAQLAAALAQITALVAAIEAAAARIENCAVTVAAIIH
jgi:prefoldin subunit 5